MFTVGADGTLQMFKNGHCIGTSKAKPMRSMARRYLYVGGHPFWKDHYFRGTIRDVHIWDRPVTWDELVATGPRWMAAPPSGVWKGEFTSRNVPPGWQQDDLQFEDGGTVTTTAKCQYGIYPGRGTWTREGAFVMNYPEEVFTGTVATGGQVAHRRSLPKERRERRRPVPRLKHHLGGRSGRAQQELARDGEREHLFEVEARRKGLAHDARLDDVRHVLAVVDVAGDVHVQPLLHVLLQAERIHSIRKATPE